MEVRESGRRRGRDRGERRSVERARRQTDLHTRDAGGEWSRRSLSYGQGDHLHGAARIIDYFGDMQMTTRFATETCGRFRLALVGLARVFVEAQALFRREARLRGDRRRLNGLPDHML